MNKQKWTNLWKFIFENQPLNIYSVNDNQEHDSPQLEIFKWITKNKQDNLLFYFDYQVHVHILGSSRQREGYYDIYHISIMISEYANLIVSNHFTVVMIIILWKVLSIISLVLFILRNQSIKWTCIDQWETLLAVSYN